jgi:RimJ/RimL family protein N-acetyltransferase
VDTALLSEPCCSPLYIPANLETERLILRPFNMGDLTALVSLLGDPVVMRYVNFGERTPVQVESELCGYISHYQQYGFGPVAIVDKFSEKLIGKAGLYFSDRHLDPQLCYLLDRSYWGQGIATEATAASLDYGLNKLKFRRVVAFVQKPNIASRRVAEKLGMRCETEDFHYASLHYIQYGITAEPKR